MALFRDDASECVQMMMNTLLHSHEVFRSLLAFLSSLISIIKQALPFHPRKAVGNSNEFTCASHSKRVCADTGSPAGQWEIIQ